MVLGGACRANGVIVDGLLQGQCLTTCRKRASARRVMTVSPRGSPVSHRIVSPMAHGSAVRRNQRPRCLIKSRGAQIDFG